MKVTAYQAYQACDDIFEAEQKVAEEILRHSGIYDKLREKCKTVNGWAAWSYNWRPACDSRWFPALVGHLRANGWIATIYGEAIQIEYPVASTPAALAEEWEKYWVELEV